MTTLTDPSDRAVDAAPDGDAGTPTAAVQPSFAELGVDPAICAALEEQGILTPFAIQAMTVVDALAGRDVCGKAKTGSGKTLAFGVPLLQRTMARPATEPGRPRALVLVPTRELAVQVRVPWSASSCVCVCTRARSPVPRRSGPRAGGCRREEARSWPCASRRRAGRRGRARQRVEAWRRVCQLG